MASYLAYVRATRITGRVIATQLSVTHYGVYAPRFDPEILIRWGSLRRMGNPGAVLNRADAIRRASDKVATLECLQEAGLPHVPFFLNWEEALAFTGGRGIILGRTRSGMRGRGIIVYDPTNSYGNEYAREPVFPHDWYSVYQEPTREVRLHVVGHEVVRVQGKYLDFPELAVRNPFVRNYVTGYRFREPRKELNTSRKNAAIEAVEALGLDFGAVDMLLPYGSILEVNTAPACSPLTASAYVEGLTRMLVD